MADIKLLLIGVLVPLLSCISSQRIENFHSSGAYFKYLGDLKIQDDVLVISSYIDLIPFHNASDMIENAVIKCRTLCLKHTQTKLNCHNNKDLEKIEVMKNQIKADLENLYQTFGKKTENQQRKRRDLNIRSRFFFRTTRGVAKISRDLNNLKSTFQRNLEVVKSEISNQDKINKILKDGNEEIAKNICIHQTKMNKAVDSITKLQNVVNKLDGNVKDLSLEATFSDLRSKVTEISLQLVEIKQSILDLQKNVLHSIIISPEEFIKFLQIYEGNQEFLATPHINNYQKIIQTVESEAVLDIPSKTVMIFIKVPIYATNNRLYEVISVPMIKNHKILSVPINDKFCVITEDKMHFHCMNNEHGFLRMDDFYVCTENKDIPFLPVSTHSKCIMNLYKGRSFENCNFREIPQNLEIFHKLETNTHLFAMRDDTKYKFECHNATSQWNNFDKNATLSGTGIVHLSQGCKLYTDDSTMESEPINDKQDNLKKDVFKMDMDATIDQVFSNHKFIKEVPTKKTLIKLDFIKFLKMEEFEEFQVEE